jgi:hypothetical protein
MAKLMIEYDLERVRDLLCSGFEGGVGYWCCIDGYTKPKGKSPAIAKWKWPVAVGEREEWPPYCWYPLAGGAVLCTEDCHEGDAPKERVLDAAAIDRGLKVMAKKYPRHFGNWLSERDDAETGDVFIQCCLLGEIVYG